MRGDDVVVTRQGDSIGAAGLIKSRGTDHCCFSDQEETRHTWDQTNQQQYSLCVCIFEYLEPKKDEVKCDVDQLMDLLGVDSAGTSTTTDLRPGVVIGMAYLEEDRDGAHIRPLENACHRKFSSGHPNSALETNEATKRRECSDIKNDRTKTTDRGEESYRNETKLLKQQTSGLPNQRQIKLNNINLICKTLDLMIVKNGSRWTLPNRLMTNEEFFEYCDQNAKAAEWAGEPEIRALSRHCKRMVQVIQAVERSLNPSSKSYWMEFRMFGGYRIRLKLLTEQGMANGGRRWSELGLRLNTGQSEDWNSTVNAPNGYISFLELMEGMGQMEVMEENKGFRGLRQDKDSTKIKGQKSRRYRIKRLRTIRKKSRAVEQDRKAENSGKESIGVKKSPTKARSFISLNNKSIIKE
ncbi:hypothetical protein BY996DRAFT_6465732 [Phakopsora pachyrhizi]|nr:hypothetical protein BY996DRAFT_6465732 [Phakopsora pachyrhizi]